MWTNPRTGSKRYCLSPVSTILLSINPNSLEVQAQKTLDNSEVAVLRMDGDRLYAASSLRANCSVQKNISLSELDANLEPKPLFQTKNVNNLEVGDFLINSEKFIVVGDLKTFLPSALTVKMMSLDELSSYKGEDKLGESFWEKQEEVGNGFVLVVGKNGMPLADKVFPDQLNKHISSIIQMGDNHYVAVGSAAGDRGWTFWFRLNDTNLGLTDRLTSWLRRIWVFFDRWF
jgi:hypothetical protein